jgi:hypothetical protein
MLKAVTELIIGPPSIWHIPFEPFPPTAALVGSSGQITETVTLYFPEQYDQSSQNIFHDKAKRLGKALERTAKGFKFFAGGWVVERIESPGTVFKSRAYVILTGWESKDAALDFKNTKAFIDNIQSLFKSRDVQKHYIFHVSARELLKE